MRSGLCGRVKIKPSPRPSQQALTERVKELTCLQEVAQVAAAPGLSLDASLQQIAERLPSAWPYPEVAFARILVGGRSYATPGFRESAWKQTARIIVGVLAGALLKCTMRDPSPNRTRALS